ncbi:TPA: hypothetical protein ACNUUK_001957 [Aeromonas salmonicida subsp. smithia]
MAYAIDITRTSTTPGFSRELSAFVAYHQLQMDGWQQLLTGTGDVTLTAPDGTKKTVPSWEKVMSAGSGVVTQAKTEADRAKTEATKAEASAASASHAVSAAALPLPDVWAPLSDSLRLITGNGRDVLVGSDVVARMVNFTRNTTKTYQAKDGSLKIAAVNEPAFESNGLLMEGRSTNLIANHATPTSAQQCTSSGTEPAPMAGNDAKVYQVTDASGGPYVRFGSAVSGAAADTKTASVWVKALNRQLTFILDCEDGVPKEVVVPIGMWTRLSTTRTAQSAGFSNFFDVGIKSGAAQVGDRFAVWGGQLEVLPFASSLIMTSGAAATREADRAWIQASGNIGRVGTISVIATPLNPLMPRAFVFGASGFGGVEASGGGSYLFTGLGQSSIFIPIGLDKNTKVFARRVTAVTFGAADRSAVTSMEPGGADWGDFIHIGGVLTAGAHKLPFWGHLRDFKVWMEPRNLSDAQLKAVA